MISYLLRCELHKIFVKPSNRIICAVLVVVVMVFSYLAVTSVRYVDASGEVQANWQSGASLIAQRSQLAGPLTPEVIQHIVDNYAQVRTQYGNTVPESVYSENMQQGEAIVFLASKILSGDRRDYDPHAILGADHTQINEIYATYRAHMADVVNEYGKTPQQRAFLQERFNQVQLPLVYEATDGWSTIMFYATIVSIMLVIGVGFLCSGLFADELQGNRDAVFFTTQHSRLRAIVVKTVVGLLIATGVYGAGIGLMVAICGAAFGLSGANAPYQLERAFSIYPYSIGTMVLVVIGFGYLAALIAASVVMLTTAITRQRTLAVALPFVLFVVSPFIGRALPFKTFFSLTPDQLLNIINNTKIPNIYQIGDHVFAQLPLLAMIYTGLIPVLLVLAFNRFRAHGLVRR